MTAFALARLGEDEATADGLLIACRDPQRSPDFSACGGPAAEAYWERFGPARLLADIAMKQQLLRIHSLKPLVTEADLDSPVEPDGPWRRCAAHDWTLWPCDTVRVVVATWSAHPGYRQEWKP